jgi:hypothetical protein
MVGRFALFVLTLAGGLLAQEIPAEVSPAAADALVLKDSNGRDARVSDLSRQSRDSQFLGDLVHPVPRGNAAAG